RLVILTFAAAVLGGCKTGSADPYISPRVVGRVLDAQTSQPLARVTVHRVTPDQPPRPAVVRHGGEALDQTPFVRTGPDGQFALDSERDLTPFRHTGWYAVSVAFDLPGYQSKVIDYTMANATNNANGEPIVQAGDIRLAPVKP